MHQSFFAILIDCRTLYIYHSKLELLQMIIVDAWDIVFNMGLYYNQ